MDDFDMGFPEDVLIETRLNFKESSGWEIASYRIISPFQTKGFATYNHQHCGLFRYLLKDLLRPVLPPQAGKFLIVGFCANINKSIYWFDEDDLEPMYQELRALPEQI